MKVFQRPSVYYTCRIKIYLCYFCGLLRMNGYSVNNLISVHYTFSKCKWHKRLNKTFVVFYHSLKSHVGIIFCKVIDPFSCVIWKRRNIVDKGENTKSRDKTLVKWVSVSKMWNEGEPHFGNCLVCKNKNLFCPLYNKRKNAERWNLVTVWYWSPKNFNAAATSTYCHPLPQLIRTCVSVSKWPFNE